MFNQVDYIMIIVSDMQKSIEFYRDKLGLALKFESPDWTEFNTGATTLALHGGGKKPEVANLGKNAGSCSFGFSVKDLEKTYVELQAKGVDFAMPPQAREGEPIKLAVAIDPDGLAISFSERIG